MIDDIPPPECNEGTLEWIKFEDLNKIPTPETDRFIYNYISKNKKFAFNTVYNKDLKLISMIEEFENIKLV